MAVFLDLEKALELASPDAVLAALATKGIGGKLRSWIKDFFTVVLHMSCFKAGSPPTIHT